MALVSSHGEWNPIKEQQIDGTHVAEEQLIFYTSHAQRMYRSSDVLSSYNLTDQIVAVAAAKALEDAIMSQHAPIVWLDNLVQVDLTGQARQSTLDSLNKYGR